ncbi:MAG: CHAT domain-containing protein, partial [Symploca sp. SIO3E6]|nr:CHAT domain-containing protein [Caldora sp. SIO3E6]
VLSTHETSQKGIRGLAEIASGKTRQRQEERLKQLHQLLIEPIADLLPSDPNARVIFIPQEELFLVPFPALQDESGKHLIKKHTILTAPSIQVLELTRQQRQKLGSWESGVANGEYIVVGNPTMPKVAPTPGESPEPLEPLPGAEEEATEIASLLNTQAIIGSQATETAIVEQMSKARLIHLATHGLLNNLYNADIPGAIALAPSSKDDGLLTASEILNLKLNAELVVLSACNTGQGRITSDGVIGLSRSLFTAGVPSVIASLWKVPDEPTAFLMKNFYKNLRKKPDKAQALRQAMLTTMNEYPHPKNWAAFTLIGEAE